MLPIEAQLLLALRAFAADRGYTLNEGPLAALTIPLANNNTLDVPIIELSLEKPCTP